MAPKGRQEPQRAKNAATSQAITSSATQLSSIQAHDQKRCPNGVAKDTPIALGIDLGAEHSRVAAFLQGERGLYLKVLGEADGEDETRSTFCARSQHSFSVGPSNTGVNPSNFVYDACQNTEFEPKTTPTTPANTKRRQPSADSCWYAKRTPAGSYQLPAGIFSQETIITRLLQHLRSIAARDLECDESKLKQVVIAIPAFSTNSYRKVVRSAAMASGFATVRLLNQSTAATIAYKRENYDPETCHPLGSRLLGVVSAGAKSLEASILSIAEGGACQLVSTSGSATLGGRDITAAMVETVRKLYKETCRVNKSSESQLTRIDSKDFIRAAWNACEKAKTALASCEQTRSTIEVFGTAIGLKTDRDQISTQPKARQMLRLLAEAFPKEYRDRLDELLLVGGSSKLIVDQLRGTHAPNARRTTNVSSSRAVVTGAAIKAAVLFLPTETASGLYYANVGDFAYHTVYAGMKSLLRGVVVNPFDAVPTVSKKKAPLTVEQQNQGEIQITYENGEVIDVYKPSKGNNFAVEMDECGCVCVKQIQGAKPEVRKTIALERPPSIPVPTQPNRISSTGAPPNTTPVPAPKPTKPSPSNPPPAQTSQPFQPSPSNPPPTGTSPTSASRPKSFVAKPTPKLRDPRLAHIAPIPSSREKELSPRGGKAVTPINGPTTTPATTSKRAASGCSNGAPSAKKTRSEVIDLAEDDEEGSISLPSGHSRPTINHHPPPHSTRANTSRMQQADKSRNTFRYHAAKVHDDEKPSEEPRTGSGDEEGEDEGASNSKWASLRAEAAIAPKTLMTNAEEAHEKLIAVVRKRERGDCSKLETALKHNLNRFCTNLNVTQKSWNMRKKKAIDTWTNYTKEVLAELKKHRKLSGEVANEANTIFTMYLSSMDCGK